MGSKNRIFLGIITSQILHHCRNIFNENKLVISKKKAEKVKVNHFKQAEYIYEYKFQELLNMTIATCIYKQDGITNFITYDGESYLIYGISVNNYHNELSTIAIIQQTSIYQRLEKSTIARRKVAGATSSFNAFQRSKCAFF